MAGARTSFGLTHGIGSSFSAGTFAAKRYRRIDAPTTTLMIHDPPRPPTPAERRSTISAAALAMAPMTALTRICARAKVTASRDLPVHERFPPLRRERIELRAGRIPSDRVRAVGRGD